MIDSDTKFKNYCYLVSVAETQRKVRDCEIEGSCYNLEGALETSYDLGLINYASLIELLDILRRKEG